MSKKLITACLGLVALAAFVMPAVASASPELGETKSPGVWTKLEPSTGECTAVKGTICITATNVGNTLFKTDPNEGAPTTLVECEKATMTGYLVKNNGTEIEATIHTATFEKGGGEGEINKMKECKGTFGPVTPTANGNEVDGEKITNGTPWCIKSSGGGTDNFTIRGGSCSELARAMTFILDATFTSGNITQCKYERGSTEPIKGTFTTDTKEGEDLNKDAILKVTATATNKADTTFKGEAGNSILCPVNGTLEMSLTLETDVSPFEPLYIR